MRSADCSKSSCPSIESAPLGHSQTQTRRTLASSFLVLSSETTVSHRDGGGPPPHQPAKRREWTPSGLQTLLAEWTPTKVLDRPAMKATSRPRLYRSRNGRSLMSLHFLNAWTLQIDSTSLSACWWSKSFEAPPVHFTLREQAMPEHLTIRVVASQCKENDRSLRVSRRREPSR